MKPDEYARGYQDGYADGRGDQLSDDIAALAARGGEYSKQILSEPASPYDTSRTMLPGRPDSTGTSLEIATRSRPFKSVLTCETDRPSLCALRDTARYKSMVYHAIIRDIEHDIVTITNYIKPDRKRTIKRTRAAIKSAKARLQDTNYALATRVSDVSAVDRRVTLATEALAASEDSPRVECELLEGLANDADLELSHIREAIDGYMLGSLRDVIRSLWNREVKRQLTEQEQQFCKKLESKHNRKFLLYGYSHLNGQRKDLTMYCELAKEHADKARRQVASH